MTYLIYAVLGIFIVLFMLFTVTVGWAIIIVLMIISLFIPRTQSTSSESSSDHYIHVPIQTVPPEYYEQYSLYLVSQQWRDLRRKVLRRDKYRCVDCLARAYHKDFYPTGTKLQVHHIHYDGIETMTFSMDQCVSVCSTCHDIRHGR